MKLAPRKLGPLKINYSLDLAIFGAFLLAMDPRATGIAIHEWFSIAFAGTLIVHLLLHWDWIANIVRRFFGRLARQARLNSILNIVVITHKYSP